MECRESCGACCIYPSISSPIPGMPEGKPAMMPCVNLSPDLKCMIFGHPDRPAVCRGFMPEEAVCGQNEEEARKNFYWLLGIEV